MTIPIPPCKDCPDRVAEDPDKHTKDCHTYCKKYQDYKSKNKAYKNKIREEHMLDYQSMHLYWD